MRLVGELVALSYYFFKTQNVLMDQDGYGMIDPKEIANDEKRREDTVKNALSPMTTQGEIGALF